MYFLNIVDWSGRWRLRGISVTGEIPQEHIATRKLTARPPESVHLKRKSTSFGFIANNLYYEIGSGIRLYGKKDL
ncbi:hypothetical protein ABB05_19665 [Lederbergia galactosidilytica]|uniref:Uncharacterized protein n=1 Tax=Lederbergia galactosidilytica TaxID=217031 RepID=A0A177ZIR5_9BACI|nr:hypothetical protein ABB05_19665 [Lederbergia galactosidilytica]